LAESVSVVMSPVRDLAMDQQLRARVVDAASAAHSHALPDEDALVSTASRRRDALYRRSLIVADALASAGALFFSIAMVGGGTLRPTLAPAVVIVVILGKLLGLYDRDEHVFHKSTLDEAPKHFELALAYTLFVWFMAPWLIDGTFTRAAGLALVVASFALTVMLRTLARGFARRVGPLERVLIIGRSGTRMRLAGKLTAAQPGTEVVGYLPLEDERRVRIQWDGHDRRRRSLTLDDLPELARQLDVHRVIIIPGNANSDTMIDAISRSKASGVKVSILPRLFEVVGSSVEFDDIEGVTVLGVRRFGLSRSSAAVKRAMDVTLAAGALLVLAPVLIVIAIAIKLDSHGPVFYRQARIGKRGRAFHMIKFRSMIDGADALKAALMERSVAGDGLFKIADDPRITRVGRILRKASFDELPQLINVLRGEMSLVGPRPLIPDEDNRINGRFRRRLRLVPGMTGPWQILGPMRVPLTEMVGIDYLYGANWSLWADIKILIRTVGHVLSRRGV
jgi:exopolysaccharide biosynthesis polyprenyl glycosylphosphotransferase